MTTFITIIYVLVALVMILSILLQAGKGGGLGSALGGGASQGVFGGGGGADFMSKLTQGFAATFMICAMYLAYASAHAGSDFLEEQDEGAAGLLEPDEKIDYERLGPRAQQLPTVEQGKAMQAKAAAFVPPQSAAPADMLDDAAAPSEPTEPTEPTGDRPPEEPAPTNQDPSKDQAQDRGDSPDQDRGDSPHRGKDHQVDSVPTSKPSDDDEADDDSK